MQILTDFYASMLLPFQPDVYTFKHTNPTNRSYTVQNLIRCCVKQQSSHRIFLFKLLLIHCIAIISLTTKSSEHLLHTACRNSIRELSSLPRYNFRSCVLKIQLLMFLFAVQCRAVAERWAPSVATLSTPNYTKGV